MKVSIFVLGSILSSVSSAPSSLRSATVNTKAIDNVKTEMYDTRIIIGGLSNMISNEEVDFVSKELVSAYNAIFGLENTNQKLAGIETSGFSTIPDDSFWWKNDKTSNEEAAMINAQVDVTYREDGFGGNSDLFGPLHDKFQENLCLRLRLSAFPNFLDAKDCYFSFLDKEGISKEGPVKNAYGNDKVTEAQLTLVGLKSQMNEADKEFVNEVVLDAHNQAFVKSGLSIDSFETLADISVGAHQGWLHSCNYCCPYDDEDPRCPSDANADAVTIVVARVVASGHEDHQDGVNNFMQTKISHADFEDFVCFKLRNSGKPIFENVHDCGFHFVFNQPVVKEALSQD